MDIAATAINSFLKQIGKSGQLNLILRRFRGRHSSGTKEHYYNDILIPHKIKVFEKGMELIELAENYHEFKNVRLVEHDFSKLSKEEEAYSDKEDVDKFTVAWHHHIHKNTHHPEHWFFVNNTGTTSVLEMPKDDVLEMVVNWMSKDFEYMLNEKMPMYGFHKNTATHLKYILDQLGIETKLKNNDNFFNEGDNSKIYRITR